MGVEIDIEYVGGLKTRCVHGPSGKTLDTTPPKDNQGDGSSYSPTDLAATSLASCAVTTMAMAARNLGVELGNVRAHVEKIMSSDAPRRIVGLPMTVTVPGGIAAELREKLEAAARGCPVARSLNPEIDATMRFEWT